LLFVARPDGLVIAMDAKDGKELWHFQTGFASASGIITYTIKGEQYIALAAMGSNQPYARLQFGDAVWAFKLGGKALYTTGPQSHPVVVSGSSQAPSPAPIENLRRPVDNASGEGLPPNTIWLAYQTRASRMSIVRGGRGGFGGPGGPGGPGGRGGQANAVAASLDPVRDSVATASMLPSQLTVPVGTTVTFTNPGDAQIGGPNTGNLKEHCATQFFEGKFNFRLKPGQSAHFKFDREGEYYYNDCTDPRPTGKVIVTLQPEDAAVQFASDILDLRSRNGLFTGIAGTVQATMTIPRGWALDKAVPVTIAAPLSAQRFHAVKAVVSGTKLVVTFNKADIENNVPAGDAEPLTVSANFIADGVQKKLQGIARVKILK
jgi:plastocyanin